MKTSKILSSASALMLLAVSPSAHADNVQRIAATKARACPAGAPADVCAEIRNGGPSWMDKEHSLLIEDSLRTGLKKLEPQQRASR